MLPQAVATTATVAEAWTSSPRFWHKPYIQKERGPEGPRSFCRRRVMPTDLPQLRLAQAADGIKAQRFEAHARIHQGFEVCSRLPERLVAIPG